MTTKRMGGTTVALRASFEPRCGKCRGKTFLKAERFSNPDEVQVSAVCDHGQGNFLDDVRTFNGSAWRLRGDELVRESFTAQPPFALAKAKDKAPPPTTPPSNKAAWFRRVDALRTGDVIEGVLGDLQRTYLVEGQKAVVVSTTKGVNDIRVRYRTLPDNRYSTFTCRGSLEVHMLGNEHLPNEALAAGAVDELSVGDDVLVKRVDQYGKAFMAEGSVVAPYDTGAWRVKLNREPGVVVVVTQRDLASKSCVRI